MIFDLCQEIGLRYARNQDNPTNAKTTKIGAFVLNIVSFLRSSSNFFCFIIQTSFLNLYNQTHKQV